MDLLLVEDDADYADTLRSELTALHLHQRGGAGSTR